MIAPGVGRGRGIRADVNLFTVTHLVHSLVVKAVAFCFHAEFSYAGTKAPTACVGGSRSPPITPGRLCPDLAGLALSGRDSLALCLPALSDEAEPLHRYQEQLGALVRRPPGLQILIVFTSVFSTTKLFLLSSLLWGGGWGFGLGG